MSRSLFLLSMLTFSSIQAINQIARDAGARIMDIYHNEDFSQVVDFKADSSPLTIADREAHRIIEAELHKIYPDIPVLSEEGKHTDYEIRKKWPVYWLVDPLDGTKEFIKRNGEFTVNIALIENNRPIAGVIYAPVPQVLYFATMLFGAFKQAHNQEPSPIEVNNKSTDLIAVSSRSHADEAEEKLLSQYPISGQVAIGSSLKFCLIAEGNADLYYRHGPTMEWDTGAGQAILEIAGGTVKNLEGENLPYNKPSLVNGSFICQG
ncbi:MAG: 3'(2'),5'-bisphosphate nucleotidase CysQ [Bacteroidota bacterium]